MQSTIELSVEEVREAIKRYVSIKMGIPVQDCAVIDAILVWDEHIESHVFNGMKISTTLDTGKR